MIHQGDLITFFQKVANDKNEYIKVLVNDGLIMKGALVN